MTITTQQTQRGPAEVLAAVREGRMSGFQIITVSIALMLVVLDGFEVGIMAFAAPQIQEQMGISPDILGYVLSGSLFGMAIGSITLTPLADRMGRRPLTLMMLVLIVVGMALTLTATSASTLILWRIVTGLGIGGMMANLNALVAEYSSDRRRTTAIAIYAAGYPIGATIAGFLARPLIPMYGWHAMFLAGTILAVVALIISWIRLPESLDYLLAKRPANALNRVNRILGKMNLEPLRELPENQVSETASVEKKGAIQEILTPPTLRLTLALWIGYGLLVAAYYFANTWIPTILSNVTGDQQLGTTMGIGANLGGVLGCFVFAALAIRFSGRLLLFLSLFAAAGAFVLFGLIFNVVSVAIAVGFLLGVLTTGAIAGFYAVAPTVYSVQARATGIGWMIGLGRLVSVAAPIIVGYILAAGVAPERVFFLFAIPLAISGLAAGSLLLGRRHSALAD
ncbi:4-hydroxybenzoate transporter PcaK [Corynebacterium occultum]|uniref:4-hydroxybenzoate transporter PcaK n=1 Tax=Corynebacterium occultum TaxID=2675219 RepID=A0A6B8VKX9_9CORY|nr:MFS transporter [Corynebacterium occultum]QGU06072.1 4-hydroxybenzoate transporter PcaK [Corynebacterium occultum]